MTMKWDKEVFLSAVAGVDIQVFDAAAVSHCLVQV